MILDNFLTALKATGILFARDAWDDMEPNTNYGVLVIDGKPNCIWGDNRIVYQSVTAKVYLYTFGDDQSPIKAVQQVLTDQCASYALTNAVYHEDICGNEWEFTCQVDVTADLAVV